MHIWLSVSAIGAALALVGIGLLARDWRRGVVRGAELVSVIILMVIVGYVAFLELVRGYDLHGLSELGIWAVIGAALAIAARRRRRLQGH